MEIQTQITAQSTERVTLTLKPGSLPRLEIVDEMGRTHYRAVELTELLRLLDSSAVLEQLKQESVRRTKIPPLPPRTLLVDVMETPHETRYVVTGWMESVGWSMVFDEHVYSVRLPQIIYRAIWVGENGGQLVNLSVAVAGDGLEGGNNAPATTETRLYRWPFSNVYSHTQNVCWPTMDRETMELSEIPVMGVWGFLMVRNNTDLFGPSISHNAPAQNYQEFLETVQNEGLKREWLIPLNMDARDFHSRATDWRYQ